MTDKKLFKMARLVMDLETHRERCDIHVSMTLKKWPSIIIYDKRDGGAKITFYETEEFLVMGMGDNAVYDPEFENAYKALCEIGRFLGVEKNVDR